MQSYQSMLYFLPYIDASLSDQVALAVVMCGQAMPQLRIVSTKYINPLPLLRALGDRECPLDHVKVASLWVCTILVWVFSQLLYMSPSFTRLLLQGALKW